MTDPTDELQELAAEVARTIKENRKFLARLMDDDFEPEDDEDGHEQGDETPVG